MGPSLNNWKTQVKKELFGQNDPFQVGVGNFFEGENC